MSAKVRKYNNKNNTKLRTHGSGQDVVRTRIQKMTFTDSLVCEFNPLSHGVALNMTNKTSVRNCDHVTFFA